MKLRQCLLSPLFSLSPRPQKDLTHSLGVLLLYTRSHLPVPELAFKLKSEVATEDKNTALSHISRVNSFQPQNPQKADPGLCLHSCWPAHCLQSCRDPTLGRELLTPLRKRHLDTGCWMLVVAWVQQWKRAPLSIPHPSSLPGRLER